MAMSVKVLKGTALDFPMLSTTMHGQPLIYLDNAATTQKPQVVIDTLVDYYQNHYGTVNRAVYDLAAEATERYEEVRKVVQKFLNASQPEEIIFTGGTTDSINLVASICGKALIKPGDEILITEIEHHSNLVPWQMVCEERGAHLKAARVDDRGVLDLNHFRKLLNSKTKVVALAHVSNLLGTTLPVKEVIRMAHEAGALVLVDGAQAAPHFSVDVQDLDADFYAFSGHKTYGPTGVGVLYGKYELLDKLPPYRGGGDMTDKVKIEKTTYRKPPLKFEAGTSPVGPVLGLGSAIEYLNQVGMDRIYEWETELLHEAMRQMQDIPGLTILGSPPERGAIVSFQVDGIHSQDLGRLFNQKGIAVRSGHLCAQPTLARFGVTNTTRISFSFYNNKEEIGRFVHALKSIVER